MAKIKDKDIKKLEGWDQKELRKLRILINNRLGSLDSFRKTKELPNSHLLFGMEAGQCKELLANVLRAEKKL
jgi:hypothetical protein